MSHTYKQWHRPPIHQNQGITQQKGQQKFRDFTGIDSSAAKNAPINKADLTND